MFPHFNQIEESSQAPNAMRILFLNHNLIWRGTFYRCLGFARELVAQGHEVHIWSCARSRECLGSTLTIDGVNIWQTPRWGGLGRHDGGYAPVDNLCRLAGVSLAAFDVVHAFDHRPNVYLPWRWLKIKSSLFGRKTLFVSDWCDWWTAGGITTNRRPFKWIDRIEQRIEEGSKLESDGVTVISSVLQERAESIGVESSRLLHLPAGASPKRFPVLDKEESRRLLNLPTDVPVLGFIGYALWDMRLLADIFTAIKQRIPGAVLLVIGGGVEASATDLFREHFALGQDVLLPGEVPFDEVPAYLAACDVHLLPLEDTPANRARIPNKLLDYYASARPVVASDVGDTGQWIKIHETGEAVENRPENFAMAVERILHNPVDLIDFGKNGRLRVEGELSYKQLTGKLLDFYRSVETNRK